MRLFHGTSHENAMLIQAHGFVASSDGQLGCGVYLAEFEKAARFAQSAQARGKGAGAAVVECDVDLGQHVRLSHPTSSWSADSAYVDSTALSNHGEWCIRNARRVRAVRVHILQARHVAHVQPAFVPQYVALNAQMQTPHYAHPMLAYAPPFIVHNNDAQALLMHLAQMSQPRVYYPL